MKELNFDKLITEINEFIKKNKLTKKLMAKMLEFNRVTFLLWINRKQKPTRKNIYQLSNKFNELKEKENAGY